MILDAIFSVLNGIAYYIVTLFPNADLSFASTLASKLADFKLLLDQIGYFIPVQDIFNVIGIIILIESSFYIYSILMWSVKWLPWVR